MAFPAADLSCEDLEVGRPDLRLAFPADEDVEEDSSFSFVEFDHFILV